MTSWDGIGHGLTFHAARPLSCQNIYVRTFAPSDFLAESAQEWDCIDFRKRNQPVRSATLTWTLSQPATVFGFGLWWEALLQPGVLLSTAPSSPRTHWEQIFMPVLTPLKLVQGDCLTLSLSVDSRQEIRINVAWKIRVRAADGTERAHQSLDMQRGRID